MPTFLKPKRRRGYFRALKRKEAWAVLKKTTDDMLNSLNTEMFKKSLAPHPFLKLMRLTEQIDE